MFLYLYIHILLRGPLKYIELGTEKRRDTSGLSERLFPIHLYIFLALQGATSINMYSSLCIPMCLSPNSIHVGTGLEYGWGMFS